MFPERERETVTLRREEEGGNEREKETGEVKRDIEREEGAERGAGRAP